MYLNSKLQPNQTEELLTAGSGFNLSCHGNGPVRWFSTAFSLRDRGDLTDTVAVNQSNPRHTGTYRCGYKNRSLEHLEAWIHLYVSGKTPGGHARFLKPPCGHAHRVQVRILVG